jgi:hypothetical protein
LSKNEQQSIHGGGVFVLEWFASPTINVVQLLIFSVSLQRELLVPINRFWDKLTKGQTKVLVFFVCNILIIQFDNPKIKYKILL